MGRKVHTFFFNATQRGQGKDLKSAAVRQNRAIPIHKLMQTTHGTDNLVTRTHMQMIGVGQFNLTAQFLQILCGHRTLNGTLCADILENRCLYGAMGTGKFTAAGISFCFQYLKHVIVLLIPYKSAWNHQS